ncbi:MAG TPA: hypothetical protein VJT31_17430 [Rugosimonospora sp.]|nr:hypothetical protein [Rugosimonospora sp.]
MGVTASLADAQLRLEPGNAASCGFTVLNNGTVVDQVTIDILGEVSAWSTVEPETVNLYPGESATATITFSPPRASEPLAGPVRFALRATSREDPAGSAVEEGVVEVGAFTEVSTTLTPRRAHGRRRGVFKLFVVNRGNASLNATVSFEDPDEMLEFRLRRRKLHLAPGLLDQRRLRVAPRRRYLRGPEQHHSFRVTVAPDHGEPTLTDAVLVQQPLLPDWVLATATATAVLLVAFVAMWFSVLKPNIKSAASNAVDAQMSPLAAAVDKAQRQAQAASNAAGHAGAALGKGSGGDAPAPANAAPALTQPVDYRIQADSAPRSGNGFDTFAVRAQRAKPLDVTDIQLQNPAGDVGMVEIRRNSTVWLRFGLQNFRDYDDHFVVPVRFNKGDTVVFAVSCKNPAGKHCTPALTFSGRTTP